MKVYTYDYQAGNVVAEEAEQFGYPHRTASGKQQYDNSHFLTWAEAHECLLANLRAGVNLESYEAKRLRTAAAAAAERVTDIAIRLLEAGRLTAPSTDPATKGE